MSLRGKARAGIGLPDAEGGHFMRRPGARLLACTAGLMTSIAFAGQPPANVPTPPEVPAPPVEGSPASPPSGSLFEDLTRRTPVEVDDAGLIGMARGSRPHVLTWEQAYTLALIAGRTPREAQRGKALAETLDPKAIAARGEQVGATDFGRFRKDFFATGGGERFRDPSAAYFELLRRYAAVDTSLNKLAAQDRLYGLLQDLIQGASSGVNQENLDELDLARAETRLRLSEERPAYADRLEALRYELGLSPGARVVIDHRVLAAFRDVFERIERWSSDPRRMFEDLPGLIVRLPELGDVVVAGRSALGESGKEPEPLEDLLTLAAKEAEQNRAARGEAADPPGDSNPLALRVRRRLRQLLHLRRAYEQEKRILILRISQSSYQLERMIAPPQMIAPHQREGPDPLGFVGLMTLNERRSRVLTSQTRLVDHWTAFREERLAFYRDLGDMPYHDWKAFLADLSPKPGRRAPAPPRTAPPDPAIPVPEAPSVEAKPEA